MIRGPWMFFLQNCIPTYVLIQNLVLDSSSLEFFIKIAYILIYLHTKLKLKNQKSKPVSQQEKKILQIHFIRNQKLKPITQRKEQTQTHFIRIWKLKSDCLLTHKPTLVVIYFKSLFPWNIYFKIAYILLHLLKI